MSSRDAGLLILLALSASAPGLWLAFDRPASPRQKQLAWLAGGLLALFCSGLAAVLWSPIEQLDFRMFPTSMEALGLLGSLSLLANLLGGSKFLILLTLGLAIFEHRCGRRLRGAAIVGVVGAEFATCAALKHLVGRARPEGTLVPVHDPSFPSGHASNTVLLYGILLLLLLGSGAAPRFRGAWIATYIAFATAMGASRIVLRAHWVLDVLSGFAWGAFWLTIYVVVTSGRWCAGLAAAPGTPEPSPQAG